MQDIIIIGAGPAGLSAAVYAVRAGHSAIVLEKEIVGGQIVFTHKLENYLGFPGGISGGDFSEACRKQAESSGVEIRMEAAESADFSGTVKVVRTAEGKYQAKAVILALGAGPRKLGIPGEQEFFGGGVSFCATCDGAFFKGQTVAVIGGGDTALEDALYLSGLVKKVYLVHRRHEFRAQKYLVDKARTKSNIEFVAGAVPLEIKGGMGVESLTVAQEGAEKSLFVSGVFIAAGRIPATEFLKGSVALDENGYILAGEDTKTSAPGVFAAGDARTTLLRQVATAVADGAVAASRAHEYLMD